MLEHLASNLVPRDTAKQHIEATEFLWHILAPNNHMRIYDMKSSSKMSKYYEVLQNDRIAFSVLTRSGRKCY